MNVFSSVTLICLSYMLLVAVVVKHNSQVIIHFHFFFIYSLFFFSFQLSSRSHEEKAGLELRSREASGYILSFFSNMYVLRSDWCGVSRHYTVPNMALQVTSKSTRFSVKIENFWKNSINVLTSFLMRAQPMSKKCKKNLSNHCWVFFQFFHFPKS